MHFSAKANSPVTVTKTSLISHLTKILQNQPTLAMVFIPNNSNMKVCF